MDDSENLSPPTEKNVRMWAMAIHLSQLGNFVVPLSGIVAPIVIWQVQKEAMPEIDAHGRNVANWLISLTLYGAIGFILFFFLIGIPILLLLGALSVVYPIIGGVKASEGKVWKYPGTIEFF